MRLKWILFVLLGVVFCLARSPRARADTLPGVDPYSYYNTSGGQNYFVANLGDNFSGTISEVDLFIIGESSSTLMKGNAILLERDTSSGTKCTGAGGYAYAGYDIGAGTGYQRGYLHTWAGSSTTMTFSSGDYLCIIGNTTQYDPAYTMGIAYDNPGWTNANFIYQTGDYAPAFPTSTYLAVRFNNNLSLLAFVLPQNGSTTTDFSSWQVYQPYAQVDPNFGDILAVHYGQSSSSFPYTDQRTLPASHQINFITKNTPLFTASDTPPLTWFAYAEYYDTSSPLGAFDVSSSIVTFFIDPNAYLPPPATTTALCAFTTGTFLSDPIGVIAQGACRVIVYSFIPTDAQNADLGTRYKAVQLNISKKPPFGYITSAISAFSPISSSSATSSTSTILNASGTAALAPILHPLDAGIATIIGFMLLTWIFNRARHFEPT